MKKKLVYLFIIFFSFTLLLGHAAQIDRALTPDIDRGLEDFDCCDIKYDYGDAPNSYHTLAGSNGARHNNAGPYMGNYWDIELNGAPSTNTDGDDIHNGLSGWSCYINDEDGVTLNDPWVAGTTATIQVAINSFSYGDGCHDDWYLNIWADFSGNGSWEPVEHIFNDLLVTPGVRDLTFNVPTTAVQFVYLRFRLSSYQNVHYYGTVCDGEVEDYRIEIIQPQLGSIGDFVWNDVNQNGFQEELSPGVLEPPVANVIVNLYKVGDPSFFKTMTTGLDGIYLFEDLVSGSYYLEFIPLAEEEWTFVIPNIGGSDIDSDAIPQNNHQSGITDDFILSPGQHLRTIDAGLYGGDPILPVTLSSFTAAYQSSNATLLWSTQSESQNSHWNIFRSLTGNSENSQQINVNGIIGAGTTSQPTDYSYSDTELNSIIPTINLEGVNVWYWLESVDNSGETELFGPVMIEVISEEFNPDTPSIEGLNGLGANYPNPFNPETKISFNLKNSSTGSLTVYNIKGAKVKVLFSSRYLEGDKLYYESWNGRDDKGFVVGSGFYMFVLKTDKEFYVRKVILQK